MSLIKWEPFFGDIDRFFEDLPAPATPKFGWDLAIDVYEKDDTVIAEMNLPGIDPEKLNVSVEDNFLRVSGSREESKEERDKHYYSKEIRRGSFERAVRLPSAVEKEKVEAEYEKGMLRVTMPKLAKPTSETVKVRVR